MPGGSVHAVQRAVTVTALSCSGLFRHSLGVSPSTVQGSLRVPAVGGGGHNRGAVKLVKPIFTHSLAQTGSPRALARRSPQGRFLARTETPCQRSHNGFASSGRPPSYALGSTHVGLPTCRFLGNDSVKPFFLFYFLWRENKRTPEAKHARQKPQHRVPGVARKRRPPQVFCPGSRREKVGSPWHSILNLKIILRGPLKVRIRVHPGGWMVGPPP